MNLAIGLFVITLAMIFIIAMVRFLTCLVNKRSKTVIPSDQTTTVGEKIVTPEQSDVLDEDKIEEDEIFLPEIVDLKPDVTTCPRCGKPALREYVCGACGYARDIK